MLNNSFSITIKEKVGGDQYKLDVIIGIRAIQCNMYNGNV